MKRNFEGQPKYDERRKERKNDTQTHTDRQESLLLFNRQNGPFQLSAGRQVSSPGQVAPSSRPSPSNVVFLYRRLVHCATGKVCLHANREICKE